VRFLLVNNHCISDPTAGVTQSLRTIIEWLADAGHACHILTTARFESAVTFTIEDHLGQQGADVSRPGSLTAPVCCSVDATAKPTRIRPVLCASSAHAQCGIVRIGKTVSVRTNIASRFTPLGAKE
jgi:hypothetical protein